MATIRSTATPWTSAARWIRGEEHVWTPETISLMQHAVREGDFGKFREFTAKVNDQTRKLKNLRGLFEFKFADNPVPLDEVEPATRIVRRFATGFQVDDARGRRHGEHW